MAKRKKIFFVTLLVVLAFSFFSAMTLAQSPGSEEEPTIAPPKGACSDPSYSQPIPGGIMSGVRQACVTCGNCDICDFLSLANKIAKIIFGSFGAVAFTMFIWGGISFILAAGSADKIKKATDILRNALIGIVIIVFAWQIVNAIVVLSVTPTDSPDWSSKVFGTAGYDWDNPCRAAQRSTPAEDKGAK